MADSLFTSMASLTQPDTLFRIVEKIVIRDKITDMGRNGYYPFINLPTIQPYDIIRIFKYEDSNGSLQTEQPLIIATSDNVMTIPLKNSSGGSSAKSVWLRFTTSYKFDIRGEIRSENSTYCALYTLIAATYTFS